MSRNRLTKKKLREAAQLAADDMLRDLPEPEECDHEFSPEFMLRMEDILHEAAEQPVKKLAVWPGIAAAAAVFALVFILTSQTNVFDNIYNRLRLAGTEAVPTDIAGPDATAAVPTEAVKTDDEARKAIVAMAGSSHTSDPDLETNEDGVPIFRLGDTIICETMTQEVAWTVEKAELFGNIGEARIDYNPEQIHRGDENNRFLLLTVRAKLMGVQEGVTDIEEAKTVYANSLSVFSAEIFNQSRVGEEICFSDAVYLDMHS